MKQFSKKQDFPHNNHFAALIFTSVYIPGDARSQEHPGHGYPSENKPIVEYLAFDSKEEMERWVAQQESRTNPYSRKSYQIIRANPYKVTTKTEVVVE